MRQPVPSGRKKQIVQPVIITTNTQFTPKISERTLQKRQALKEQQLKGAKFATGLDLCGIICLYMFLVACVLIGGGGIAICGIYFNQDPSNQGWIIVGIVLSIVTLIIGIILILLTIFKQSRNRPWQYKKKEELYNMNDYYGDMDDDNQTTIENYDDNQTPIANFDDDRIQTRSILYQGSANERKNVSQSTIINLSDDGKKREIATSPLPDPLVPPSNLKTIGSDIIFCPGCNRLHPSAHQCMYSTHIANSFATQFRSTSQAPNQDSIAIQTEGNEKKKMSTGAHTVIDRSLKYSHTTETQTNVTANPRSNITESIILRRVPIPTAKVVVQQPTTKVMIVKVPNVAGQLVIQPKPESTNEQSK